MDHSSFTERPGQKPARTLADVLATLEQRADLPAGRKTNMISSVRSLCAIFNASPSLVAADAVHVRERIDAVRWQDTGLSWSYISNLKTHTLAALQTVGVPVLSSRSRVPLHPEWASLKGRLSDIAVWCPLSRLATHCTSRGILPSEVTEDVLSQFEALLIAQSIKSDPAASARKMRCSWAKVAPTVAGTGPVKAPVRQQDRRYSLAWEAFPPSFVEDVNAFLESRADPDPFSDIYSVPVAESTTNMRRKQIQQLASALVAAGFALDGLTGLDVLTRNENAETALRYLRQRAGNKTTPYLGQQAQLLLTVGQYWVRVPDTTRLQKLASATRVKKRGMVEKNRERLSQFYTEANIDRVISLPSNVLGRLAEKTTLSTTDIASGVYAAAVTILIRTPIRAENLCGLTLGTQLMFISGRNAADTMRMALPRTKNGDPYDAPLLAEPVKLLKIYLEHVRPAITATDSPWLFPNQFGEKRSTIAFSRGLQRFIEHEIGLDMGTHFFRQFAVLLQQRFNPGDRETARQLLGHRNIATTDGAYKVMETAAAAKRHDDLVTKLLNRNSAKSETGDFNNVR